jgi:hypothetical protein
MKLNRDGARRRMKQAVAALGAALLLAACGGGDRASDFHPVRVIAFGDESSVLDDSAEAGNARKYGVNPVFSSTLNCHAYPNWTQYVAESYGLYFPECSAGLPAGAATPSLMLAAPDADVAAVKAQIDAFLAANTLGGQDLVTLYVGVHDVLNQYAAVKAGGSEADAIAAVREAGSLLAAQVNRLADAGGRVLVSFLPGVEFTPFAAAEELASPGADRAQLLARLTLQFNNQLALDMYDDGTRIGLVQFDDTVRVITQEPTDYGYAWPANRPACLEANRTPNLLTCTTSTLVAAATGTSQYWLWADDTHLAPQGQLSLGQQALERARENPF